MGHKHSRPGSAPALGTSAVPAGHSGANGRVSAPVGPSSRLPASLANSKTSSQRGVGSAPRPSAADRSTSSRPSLHGSDRPGSRHGSAMNSPQAHRRSRGASGSSAPVSPKESASMHIVDLDLVMDGLPNGRVVDPVFEAQQKLADTQKQCCCYRDLGEMFPVEVDEEEESDYFADFDSTGTNEDVISDEEIDAQAARPSKSIRLPKIKRHTALDIERAEILRDAERLGESMTEEQKNRHITVIYNPVSGGGVAKRLVERMVEPVLKATGLRYTVVPTQYRRFAVEYVKNLDVNSTQGIVIAGGDGLVHEVITGYFLHPDQEGIRKIPVGITPSGTANAMAHALHTHRSKTHVSLVGHAALAVAKGLTREVDVLEYTSPKEHIFALSVFGWGLAGAVALKADKLRWLPGQKKARYDIAGAISMLTDWPVVDDFLFSYPQDPDHPEGAWLEDHVSAINFTATNLSYLGEDHAISSRVQPDDGYIVAVAVKSNVSRLDVIGMAMNMKKGIFLEEDKQRVQAWRVKEFRIKPIKSQSPFNIDGDPHDYSECHVKVLNRALKLFALPAISDHSHRHDTDKGLTAATSVAMSVAGIPTQNLARPDEKHRPGDGAIASLLSSMMGADSLQHSGDARSPRASVSPRAQ